MVQFKNDDDVQKVLSRIHTFEGRPIILKKWCKNVNFHKEVLETVSVWLPVYNLPVHYRNEISVSKVCSSFARPIYTDDPDTTRDKGLFVRVMVEVEVKESLPEAMVVDIYSTDCDLSFKYEWKPVVCKLCSKVDHTEDKCPKKVLQSKPRKTLDRWVVKQKRKLVEGEIVDKITDNIPMRDLQTNNTIVTKKSFALLEDNEVMAQELENVVSPVVEKVNVVQQQQHVESKVDSPSILSLQKEIENIPEVVLQQ
ncbi:uncharacterized protein LOC132301643 [Cornus florida]|uniref:uncharacterized protein LOC132301643 n=1 Tax=Cornus florida TaxID=4283 RepID=UPI00289DB8EF|nr:uncharacterized protein LOC132301643 [Cornus florida]